MIKLKPYLYGGVALLIVGLFLYSATLSARLSTASLLLETATQTNEGLQNRVVELEKAQARQEAAALAYQAVSDKLDSWLPQATRIVNGYKKRETPNEKCLDLTPPDELLRLLRESNLQK